MKKGILAITFTLVALNFLFPPREWVGGTEKDPSRGFLLYQVNKSDIEYRNGRVFSWSRCKIDLERLIASGGVILFFGLAFAQLPKERKTDFERDATGQPM